MSKPKKAAKRGSRLTKAAKAEMAHLRETVKTVACDQADTVVRGINRAIAEHKADGHKAQVSAALRIRNTIAKRCSITPSLMGLGRARKRR